MVAKTHELVGLLIARGDKASLGRAMSLARRLMSEKLESPAGAREVCRVFKAADSDSVRANAFVDYLQGKGDNPLPAFSKEYPTSS